VVRCKLRQSYTGQRVVKARQQGSVGFRDPFRRGPANRYPVEERDALFTSRSNAPNRLSVSETSVDADST
jgi:hypothetical protein